MDLSTARPDSNLLLQLTKVFLIEDCPLLADAVRDLISQTADMIFVGTAGLNNEEMLAKVKAANPDVLLVDLVLKDGILYEHVAKFPEYDGVAAIRLLRAQFPNARIVGYSHWPQGREDVMGAGGDGLIHKSSTGDIVRQEIRNVCGGRQVEAGIGPVVGLEIYLSLHNNQMIVVGERDRTPRISVKPYACAFLCYLAEERRLNKSGFVALINGSYVLTQPEIWRRICDQTGTNHGASTTYPLSEQVLPGLCTHINRPLRQREIDAIVQTPGPHAIRGPHRLNIRILANRVLIKR